MSADRKLRICGAASRRIARLTGCLALLVVQASRAAAADYYVAPPPAGNDANAGTESAPFATFQKAQGVAAAGDTVFFRGGTYTFLSSSAADGVLINKSGASGKLIHYWAYPNETPVFDFSGMTAQVRITGFRVTASWIHFKGLELKGVPQNITTANESWGIYNTGGSNNIYEQLNLHHNQGPGLFLVRGGNNLVLNCDSHDNYDPKSNSGDGSNADGFGAHTGTGDTGNVFRGCRAWWNSDDGYDFIQAQEAVTVENSWAWYNGYLAGTMTAKGNGNGFKAGGYGLPATNVPATPPSHTIRFCLAFSNRAAGFYANHHPVADTWYNNTSYKNNPAYNMLGLNGNVGILRNNIAYGGTLFSNNSGIDDTGNAWNLGVTISDADFESVAIMGMDAPRQADGSLPIMALLRLKAGSDLIDKGKDVGLPFNGAAPDLGAFEFGMAIPAAGGGGSSGAAGSGGSGGGPAAGSGGLSAAAGRSGGAAASSAGAAAQSAGAAAVGGESGQAGSAPTTAAGSSASLAGGGAPSSGASGAGAGTPTTPSGSGGCACRTAPGADDAGGLFTLLLWVAAQRARRRVFKRS